METGMKLLLPSSKKVKPPPLAICYQNSWQVLSKYNQLTDANHEIYAAATLLNPRFRKRYFVEKWTDDAEQYIEPMLRKTKTYWEMNYAEFTTVTPPAKSQSAFQQHLYANPGNTIVGDHFAQYVAGDPLMTDWSDTSTIFHWWEGCAYHRLRQWAFDTLSIPAMSAEVERVFSSAKRTLTVERNRTGTDFLEAAECLRHWRNSGFVEQE